MWTSPAQSRRPCPQPLGKPKRFSTTTTARSPYFRDNYGFLISDFGFRRRRRWRPCKPCEVKTTPRRRRDGSASPISAPRLGNCVRDFWDGLLGSEHAVRHSSAKSASFLRRCPRSLAPHRTDAEPDPEKGLHNDAARARRLTTKKLELQVLEFPPPVWAAGPWTTTKKLESKSASFLRRCPRSLAPHLRTQSQIQRKVCIRPPPSY